MEEGIAKVPSVDAFAKVQLIAPELQKCHSRSLNPVTVSSSLTIRGESKVAN